jgi:translation initiation factor 5
LCKKCKNPETVMEIKDGRILLDCKACGQRTDVDLRLKLSGFILKNQPKKGKKDKAAKKAGRKARKEAEQNGEENGSQNSNSPHDSNSDRGDENGDYEIEAGSDDEFTRKIQNDAKEIDDAEPKEIKWSVDTSEAAVKARAEQLAADLKDKVVLDDDDAEDGGEENVYDSFGSWVLKQAQEKGGVSKVDDVDIYLKAKELGIQSKHKAVQVLAQTIFDDNIVKQIDKRAAMLKKMITSERHEKALLGGTERFVGTEKPQLIPQVSAILMKYYQNDLISEDVVKAWGSKASSKFVDKATSKKVRKAAGQFIEWLETAESGSESEDDE